MKHNTRVGVLRGGPSNQYEVSLGSGGSVLQALREKFGGKYQPHDIFIDKRGVWHMHGIPMSPEDMHRRIDVAFNALHGTYGEDGKIQTLLEAHGIPFTGSDALGSAVGMNKALSKRIFADHGIKSPYWKEISATEIREDIQAVVQRLFTSFLLPAIVKPASSGSSIGVSVVRMYDELFTALNQAADHSDIVIIEEYITGTEASCGVIESFRDQELYALPPVEIRSHTHFFDSHAKNTGASDQIVPATFDESIKRSLEEIARKVHKTLGLRHYSRSDFIIHPRRGIYVLEANSLPSLGQHSVLPRALRAVGSDVHELVDHVIQLSLRR